MISSIYIQNFKVHKNTQINLGNLTLLCGQNGVGKSSIIQTLLLLRQTYQKNLLLEGLSLNEPFCEIGKGKDALYQYAEVDNIIFELIVDTQPLKWIFDTNNALEKDFIPFDKKYLSNPTLNKILENIDNYNIASCFEILNEIVVQPNSALLVSLQQEFIEGKVSSDYVERLKVFAISLFPKSVSENNGDKAVNYARNLASHGSAITIFNDNFQYISAFREAKYEASDHQVENRKQLSNKEGRAEFTAQFLYKYQSENVTDELLHPLDKINKSLLSQTTIWEREISKGINVHPKKVGNNYEIRYSFDKDGDRTNEFSAKNVGFGISYSLPIILAILSAKKGSLVIIENPEAHLHPYGQAKLTELLCIAAQAGVQIIIETHSDHIINGVLVQCKKFETQAQGIDRNKVKIWYFEREEETHAAKAIEVEIKEKGKIKNQPSGFFDQMEKDLDTIMGF